MIYVVLLVWVLLTPGGEAWAADSFSERLASLQVQLASQPTNTDLLFKLGDLCHDEGARDNHQAVDLAEKYFKRLLALDEKHALGRVMYGSTITMMGRDAFWPSRRLSLVREGIKEMDTAVALAPNDARVRFARAANNYHMPKFMGREEIVQADFAWLWQQVQTKPEAIPADIKQQTALYQGLILRKRKQNQEAMKVWLQGLAFDPHSAYAAEIQKQLAKTAEAEKKSSGQVSPVFNRVLFGRV